MKTVQQKLNQLLLTMYGIGSGDTIIEMAKPEIEKSGPIRWDGPHDGYPKEMYGMLLLTMKPYIKEMGY